MTASLQDASTSLPERRCPARRLLWVASTGLVIATVLVLLTVFVMRRAEEFPDVGEPFDVETFAAYTLPNEQNAISQYLLAQRALVRFDPPKAAPRAGRVENSARRKTLLDWSQANEAERKWLDANRMTLEVWKRGTERDEAIEVPLDALSITSLLPAANDGRTFASLALLEASRQAGEGHASDAWNWYRACLRASRHFCMHAAGIERLFGTRIYGMARDPILNWASRPELTPAALRQAMTDALAVDEMTPPLSETFKTAFLCERNGISEVLSNLSEQHPWVAVETRFSGRPERMRRALKLFFANWIAHADRPRSERRYLPDKDVPLFEVDSPGEPPLPSPEVLKSAVSMWLSGLDTHGSTSTGPPVDFALPGMMYLFEVADHDQVNRAGVIVGLALQLYFREHGDFPLALPELVKAGYLRSIPLDPFGKGEPIHYRVEAHPPRAIVWSVGLDGVNKAGKPSVVKGDERSSEDTVFEIVAPPKAH
jgi:hypothetical protein